ncbi:MAG: hypothetical protein HOP19_12660 [Acidobacteria bacterium]|nr:hypothetical protein [Acidobacteriota bacterium]
MSETNRLVTLRFELSSAATFGRGDGLPGLVDSEVEHDAYGFPFLRGRTLRGLLAEEMESLLYALGEIGQREEWKQARCRLLGDGARLLDETGILHVGNAQLPEAVRHLIIDKAETEKKAARLEKDRTGKMPPLFFTREAVLESVTAVRRQTAMTHLGAPEPASLRAQRVILRTTQFEAPLHFDIAPETPELELELALLTAATLAWRRAGTGRNRGRGRLQAWLNDEAWTQVRFAEFAKFCQGVKPQ